MAKNPFFLFYCDRFFAELSYWISEGRREPSRSPTAEFLMPATIPCPDKAELRRLLLEQPPDDRAAALEDHVNDCPTCGERLAELSTVDSLVEVFRQVPAAMAQLPRGAVLDELRRRVRRITPSPVSTGLEADTAAGPFSRSNTLPVIPWHSISPQRRSRFEW